MIKKITYTLILFLIIIIASYQVYIENYISNSQLKAILIEQQERKRYFSFYFLYEIRRMVDWNYAEKETRYLNCLYNEINLENFNGATDYYLMHLYYSDSEKKTIRSNCSLLPGK